MKNNIFFMIIAFSFFCCNTEPNGNNDFNGYVENANVYLLGTDAYWKNGIRYTLNIPKNYNDVNTEKIIVSNSIVFVIGTAHIDTENGDRYSQACYWENGVFNTFSTDNTISVYSDNVFVSNGKIFASTYNGYWWNGKTQNKLPGDRSRILDLFVFNNTVYMAGYNYDNSWTACYWMNNNRFNLPKLGNNSSPNAGGIFVDGGNIYCSGYDAQNVFYWINGTLFNINTSSEYRYEVSSIIVSNGKTFIFGEFSNRTGGGIVTPCYWEDGILKLLPTGTNLAYKPMVYNGKVYIYDGTNYFINGEAFSVDAPVVALLGFKMININSIFLFNDDVYMTGGFYDENFKYQSCYWINGTKRINLNYSIKGIFIEPK